MLVDNSSEVETVLFECGLPGCGLESATPRSFALCLNRAKVRIFFFSIHV